MIENKENNEDRNVRRGETEKFELKRNIWINEVTVTLKQKRRHDNAVI